MKFKLIIIILCLNFLGCEKPNPTEQIKNLGGYWEIESVTLPDGTEKYFTISTTVDFIDVNGETGIRTKVSPKLDGSFETNGTSETFQIKIEDDSLRLYYATPFDQWKETVLVAKDSILKVLNRDGKQYSYKKFSTFSNFESYK